MGQTRRSRQELVAWFHDKGLPVASWAQENGFAPSVVYALLAGRTLGRRGQAHRAAVALGLKIEPKDLLLGGIDALRAGPSKPGEAP